MTTVAEQIVAGGPVLLDALTTPEGVSPATGDDRQRRPVSRGDKG